MSASAIVSNWEVTADEKQLDETVKALQANGFKVIVVENADAAKRAVLDLVPEGIDVYTAKSATLTAAGIEQEIDQSGRYNSVRNKLMSMNRETQYSEMRRLGATPTYIVGSIQAITRQGHIIAASYGGSQLAPYVYGAAKVIWVVGTQKLVNTVDEGIQRIEEYCLPYESERLQKVFGRPSEVAKLLIVRKEATPERVTIVLVKEKIGF